MGNSSSSSRGHHDETVDYGALVPQGVYTGPQDWNQANVSQAIIARRLAPFYRPLEDFKESWDDDQILAARKEPPDSDHSESVTRTEHTQTTLSSTKSKRPALKEPSRPEAQVYRGAVECPICFLYYPPNINRSRCCDQAICTECFVQIRRSEPTTTHIVSEPAACPYCVQDNFGIVYTPPVWRAGLGSDHGGILSDPQRSRSPTEPVPPPTHKRRQKSYGADSAEVVLIDHIRPDWEAKLEAVRAAVARRANRRIIMRQVGDRLIPVGVTSGRVHALSPEEVTAAAASVENGSRRGRRRVPGSEAMEQLMGMTGPDLEELMLMEAMRLSMLEHEEQQRKEAEEKRKRDAETAAAAPASMGESSAAAGGDHSTNGPVSTVINPSTADARASLPTSCSSSLSVSSGPRGRTSPVRHPGKNSHSVSRSGSPHPANPVLPSSSETQAAWRSRTEGPRMFSTLNPASTVGASNPISQATAIPTITIVQESAERSATSHSTDAERNIMSSDAPLPPLPLDAVPSTLSSTSTDGPSTSGSTSTSSSFGSLENGTRMSAHNGSGNLGSSPRTSLNSDIPALQKPVVMETTSTVHIEDVSR